MRTSRQLAHSVQGAAQRWRRAVATNFRQRIVYAWELPSIMRKHIYTGAMGGTYFTLITGIVFVYFGNAMGMTPFLWGLMGGIASWTLAGQVLSALITQKLGHRKLLWFTSAMLERTARMGGILLAYWLWHEKSPAAAPVLIAGVCVANFFSAMATPPWFSWLADLIPADQHGSFMGRRSAWIALTIILVIVPASFALDLVPAEWKLETALIIFGLATAIGMIDLVIHGTLPEPSMALPKGQSFFTQLLGPLRDRSFRPWLLFNACWTFAMTEGGALATLYFVEDLGIKRNFLGGMIVLTVIPLLGGTLTSSWTGRLVDRVGPRRMLFRAHLFWAILPLFWIVATPETALWWLAISSLLGGTSSYAAMNAANKVVTRFPPPEHRAMYIAVSSCLGSLAGGVGVMVSGAVVGTLEGWSVTWGGWTFIGFHVVFAASAVLRLVATFVLVPRIPSASPHSGDG